MKKILIMLLFCGSTAAFAQKTNFSGTWLVDTSRTAFGQAPRWIIPHTIKVDQQGSQLVLTRITVTENGAQPPVVETLAFDGTPLKRTAGSAQVTTTLNWTSDQSFSLVRDGSAKATEIWTLEDGGKTLVVLRQVEQSGGLNYTNKGYYNRQ